MIFTYQEQKKVKVKHKRADQPPSEAAQQHRKVFSEIWNQSVEEFTDHVWGQLGGIRPLVRAKSHEIMKKKFKIVIADVSACRIGQRNVLA